MFKKKLLITGGLGFIGSHTLSLIDDSEYEVHVVDNLSNSHLEVIDKLKKINSLSFNFHQLDLTDESLVNSFFNENQIDAIIHYAGYKAVHESIIKPEIYYKNNLQSTLNILNALPYLKPVKFIFSSSATVYGLNKSPVKEDMSLMGLNPYARTKIMNEEILSDYSNAHANFSLVLLRYFNPVGAHPSGLIGENPKDVPNNLMPYITKTALGEFPVLSIYGNDYKTIDGTCMRDFIHVMDLAKAHLCCLQHNFRDNISILNVGTGIPTSVREMIEVFQRVNQVKLNYKFANRREGDIDISFADNAKIKKLLNWSPEYSIEDMCLHSWNFIKK